MIVFHNNNYNFPDAAWYQFMSRDTLIITSYPSKSRNIIYAIVKLYNPWFFFRMEIKTIITCSKSLKQERHRLNLIFFPFY